MATLLKLDGSMIPRTVKRLFDHRTEPRLAPAASHATLGFRGRDYPAVLVNRSASGAMVEFEREPRIGETVVLTAGDFRTEADVRWVCEGRIGIHFATRSE